MKKKKNRDLIKELMKNLLKSFDSCYLSQYVRCQNYRFRLLFVALFRHSRNRMSYERSIGCCCCCFERLITENEGVNFQNNHQKNEISFCNVYLLVHRLGVSPQDD